VNAFFKVLRASLAALVLATLWCVFGWLSSGRWQPAIALGVISLFIAPLLVPDAVFFFLRFRKRLKPLHLNEVSPLRDLVLQCVLRQGSLRPRFWILDAPDDNGFLWLERGWGRFRRQDFVVGRGWLEGLPEASRLKEFRSLWFEIAAQNPCDRRIRTLQFRLWAGAFWMLDILFDFLHFLLRSLGLREMPHPTFWCQRLAWSLRRMCFGCEEREFLVDPFLRHAPRVDAEPLYWKSWIFGVWSRYPTRCLHPAWRVLVETSGLIES